MPPLQIVRFPLETVCHFKSKFFGSHTLCATILMLFADDNATVDAVRLASQPYVFKCFCCTGTLWSVTFYDVDRQVRDTTLY